MTLDPEGDLAEVDGQRVLVDGVDAVANHVPLGLAELGRAVAVVARAYLRQIDSDAPGRRKQEVARAGGGIEHTEAQ